MIPTRISFFIFFNRTFIPGIYVQRRRQLSSKALGAGQGKTGDAILRLFFFRSKQISVGSLLNAHLCLMRRRIISTLLAQHARCNGVLTKARKNTAPRKRERYDVIFNFSSRGKKKKRKKQRKRKRRAGFHTTHSGILLEGYTPMTKSFCFGST